MTNKIVKSNLKFGVAVVAEAKRLNEEKRKQKVVEEVQLLLNVITELKLQVKHVKDCLEHNEKRLAAIEAGEFNFDYDSLVMDFHNKDLNKSWHRVI